MNRHWIIQETHRGLWYENGLLKRTLEPGRYTIPRRWPLLRRPVVRIALVDIRERELTIKGQEILTNDKVAIRVNILVQFKVTNPSAALHNVDSYQERLYSDAQLAARRSLASMTLEEILTNRNRMSDDIRQEVEEAAAGYGVQILRAAVKDLIFPGNLQEVMNRVLTAERMSEAQLVEARTKAEAQQIAAAGEAELRERQAVVEAKNQRLAAETEAEIQRIRTQAELDALRAEAEVAKAYSEHPALLRLRELEALESLAKTSNAQIHIGFDKHADEVRAK